MYSACSDGKIPQNITFQPTTALSAVMQIPRYASKIVEIRAYWIKNRRAPWY